MKALESTKTLVPLFYQGNTDMEAVTDTYDELLATMSDELQRMWLNTFIRYADAEGISWFERIVGIRATATESLEFRRERLLNRWALTPPFTKRYLEERLDAIIGAGQYELTIDYPRFTVQVEALNSTVDWYQEIAITFVKFLPANMIYINVPKVIEPILISETIRYGELSPEAIAKHFNYKLGSWLLGQLPFGTDPLEEVVKLPETKSIQEALLAHQAAFTVQDVAAIRLNGTYKITTFSIKAASGADANFQYTVPANATGTGTITQIELLDAHDTVLTSSKCYIPNAEQLTAKHTIRFKEGV